MEDLKEITWQAPEFHYRAKSAGWYWLSLIIAALLILLALWQKNLLFILFVVIAEITLIHWARQTPRTLHFKIDKNGVSIGKIKFYAYPELEGFHIKEGEHGIGELILKTKSKLNPCLKISIDSEDAKPIENLLKKFLVEVEYEDSVSDAIDKLIGF